jgi:hypothetical protein
MLFKCNLESFAFYNLFDNCYLLFSENERRKILFDIFQKRVIHR